MNIALFFDGTWNEPMEGTVDAYRRGLRKKPGNFNSNVRNLYLACDRVSPTVQVSRYFHGLGTQSLVARRAVQGLTGYGLTDKLRDGYEFIVTHYRPGDRIYLFGFSRGAYIARTLAGLLAYTGILRPGEKRYLKRVIRLYIDASDTEHSGLRSFLQQLPDAPRDGRLPVQIHFIGVWDTVAGLPDDAISLGTGDRDTGKRWNPLPYVRRRFIEHWTRKHGSSLARHITHARHAVALHEFRRDFQPVLWTECAQGQSLEQIWFAGAHSDIGGSYERDQLSGISLSWIATEAIAKGLEVNAEVSPRIDANAGAFPGNAQIADGVVHDSASAFVRRGVFVRPVFYRKATAPAGVRAVDGTAVHPSALHRLFGHIPYADFANVLPRARLMNLVDALTLPLHLRCMLACRVDGHPDLVRWMDITAGELVAASQAKTEGGDTTKGPQVWVLLLLLHVSGGDEGLSQVGAVLAARLQEMRWLRAQHIRDRDWVAARATCAVVCDIETMISNAENVLPEQQRAQFVQALANHGLRKPDCQAYRAETNRQILRANAPLRPPLL